MMGPMVHRWILGATLVATGAVLGGCGATVVPSATPALTPSATPAAIPVATASPSVALAPWQPQPVVPLDRRLATAAETKCRARTPEADGLDVVLHDQRGDGIDTVIFAGAEGKAQCQVAGDPGGTVVFLASGGTIGHVMSTPGASDIAIAGMGSSSGSQTGSVTDISGRAGAAVASVRIRLADGRQILATTSNGWFYAWWPGEAVAVLLVGDDATGRMIATATP